jgi:hypothetical protein
MDSRPPHAVVLVAWTPLAPQPPDPGHALNLMRCGAGFVEFRSRIVFIPTMNLPAALVSRGHRRLLRREGRRGQKLAYVYYEEEGGPL